MDRPRVEHSGKIESRSARCRPLNVDPLAAKSEASRFQPMSESFWHVEWEPAARNLIAHVKEEAFAIGDEFLGTRHLLLAAVACSPLEGLPNLSLDAVRAAVVALKEPRELGSRILTPWCQTPRFKLALQRAMQRASAESRSVNCIDVWHGLLDDPESECLLVLQYLGVDPESLRNRT